MSDIVETTYQELPGGRVPIKAWTRGVPFEPGALAQLQRLATMPFVHKWVAAMPDVHVGIGATVGAGAILTDAVIGDSAVIGDRCELLAGIRVFPGVVLPAAGVRFSAES